MQREKSVKAKEVIESLCKLLYSLGLECIPSAETFRRAKFNKGEGVVVEFWKLLHSFLLKALRLECSCTTLSDLDSHVREALWQCGYGASWIVVTTARLRPRSEVGSRELLVAFGWVLSSGSLLEALLRARSLELDILSLPPTVSLSSPREGGALGDVDGQGGLKEDRLLRRLQWQYGKLRFQWRRLLSIQEERARLLHQVLSSSTMPSTSTSQPSSSDAHHSMCSTALKKEVERLQTLSQLLEAYLEWKRQESLFWCWMDSVVDSQLSDLREEDTVENMSPVHQVVNRCYPYGYKDNEGLERLDNMLLRLQTGLKDTYTRQSRKAQSVLQDVEEIERRVAHRLHGLAESCTSTPTSGCCSYRPSLQGPQPLPNHHQPCRPGSVLPQACDGAVLPGRVSGTGTVRVQVQASSLIVELQRRERFLLGELGQMRQAKQGQIQEETASRLEGVGVVLIPPLPLKR
uniref:Tubulin epsilon and delta complex 1 n=1 Tax=Hucho hucho TaxID=62062 RepID=A0A4W5Q3U1_9TELE